MVYGVSEDAQTLAGDIKPRQITARKTQIATNSERPIKSGNPNEHSGKSRNIVISTKRSGIQDICGNFIPQISLGYIDTNGNFRIFSRDEVNLFDLEQEDFAQEDRRSMVFSRTLGEGRAKVSADTKAVVLTYPQSFQLSSGVEAELFPSYWIRRDLLTNSSSNVQMNVSVMPSHKADPKNYIDGEKVDQYVLVGMAVQAPYYSESNYAWKVYVYSHSLTSNTSPNLASFMCWMNPYMVGDKVGADMLMRLQEQSAYMNTIPIIPTGTKEVQNMLINGIADGLIYLAPNSNLCHRTEVIPLVFDIKIPEDSSDVDQETHIGVYFNNSPK